MTRSPDISVVMSVFNGAPTLRETLESVLTQDGVSLEFVVVNDGSTDETGKLLEQAGAADRRLRVVHQENQGLTRALARGCDLACGRFLARQDAGDLSFPGRLRIQAAELERDPAVALVSSGSRFVGPKGEFLYEVRPSDAEATSRLHELELGSVRGPAHHGATMFRRSHYLQVGGYRAEFAVAQDLDLWLRLIEKGRHKSTPEVLYQARVSPDSISGSRRPQQIKTTKIILECAKRRRAGLGEEPLLRRAARLSDSARSASSRLSRSSALYFIGSCLKSRSPDVARWYFRESLRESPFNLRSWYRLLLLRR